MIKLFRNTALIEGISYLLLLFVAMPLKYGFSIPEPVKYLGWAHGILFIAYVVLLMICWLQYKWSFLRVVGFFFASLLPFVPFWIEKKLKKEYGSNA